jgi:hypothetical protein
MQTTTSGVKFITQELMFIHSFIVVTSATFIRDVDLEFHIPEVKAEVSHIVNSKYSVL